MSDGHIAVVGMAGRFPGAEGPEQLWEAISSGTDLLTRFPAKDGDPVPAYGIMPDADAFDAGFFGYPPGEALMIDPQQRVFLECAWSALEDAACVPDTYPGVIGVFGGSGDTDHLARLREHRDLFPGVSDWQLRLGSGMDFLTSRVAYKLNLTGPAVTVQTACSTSLVAVHLAVQALLAGDCDLALAGGVTVRVPHPDGDPGDDGVLSRDGFCRSFDAAGSGTVSSDGVGVVALKRLDDALADGDRVHGVILGSAVTNDGAAKVGFTAPGVAGQSSAIRAAHLVADVEPASIGYVEAHGTATALGDPIEVRALSAAFGSGDATLGSVKSVIGHTDAAAGVTGLIAALLALRHLTLPAVAHLTHAHPGLGLAQSPFAVRTESAPWPPGPHPRRAGVNSLGLGGTNAHVVVEQAPEPEVRPGPAGPYLLPVSARTPEALADARTRLAARLTAEPGLDPRDVAGTLRTGRRAFAHRSFVVAGDLAGAARALPSAAGAVAGDDRAVAFLFPGQGGQHHGMAADLYAAEPVFRTAIDECAELAGPELGYDLRDVLYPGADRELAEARLRSMTGCQPVLFAVQHALAELWQSRGVRPAAVLGHSLGAYAAAHTAGVMSLPDAMRLVLARGRLLDTLPDGAMLAVDLPEADLLPWLSGEAEPRVVISGADRTGNDHAGEAGAERTGSGHAGEAGRVSIAAINSPGQCVVTGPADAIESLRRRLTAGGAGVRPLRISAAAHSALADGILDDYAAVVATVTLNPPRIPWVSDRTGEFVSSVDGGYWAGHLRDTVRFAGALDTLLGSGEHILLEVGPGRTLGGFARPRPVIPSLPHAAEDAGGAVTFLEATGALWQSGVDVHWPDPPYARRVSLPTYPFRRDRFRLDQRPVPDPRPATDPEPEPVPATVRLVAEVFADVLGLPEIGPDDDFFALGGDSLTATRILTVLNGRTGRSAGVRAVFQARTPAALAAVFEEDR
ncbi:type I polyketide synthase [Actinoplanes sp. G11-F43]|uniref:type I polyketide synthase n=1 Tax=Actinoplanes sp. G11-F43 TaxID=3424130 RepID=UPI003D340148